MKLAIIGMGIMGCRYAKMISDGLVKGIEITAVTRITPERKEALKNIFDNGTEIFQIADDLFKAVRKKKVAVDGKAELFVEGAEGSKSLMLANAMYLSSWKKQMVKLPENLEEEIAFEAAYEEEFAKKVSQ